LLFLVDAQLPPSLAQALRRTGCDAIHVVDLGLAAATDQQIWDEAISRSAVLVTKDRDFALRRAASNDGPAILWVTTWDTARTGPSRSSRSLNDDFMVVHPLHHQLGQHPQIWHPSGARAGIRVNIEPVQNEVRPTSFGSAIAKMAPMGVSIRTVRTSPDVASPTNSNSMSSGSHGISIRH
jgi:predicted nuclease of predicted toxin-antitoxin system